MLAESFHTLPTELVFLLTVLVIGCSLEIGFRLGRLRVKAKPDVVGAAPDVATGAILSLLSFLLAFTFGISAAHYESRRAVIQDEANAIGTAFLRTDLLPEQERQRAATLLRDYTELRLEAAAPESDMQDYQAALRRSEAIQQELWQMAVAVSRDNPNPINALVLTSLNDLIDLHSIRLKAGVHSLIPNAIWICLYLVSAIGIGSAGFRIALNSRNRSELLPGLILAFSIAIALISDLDSPRNGFLRSSQTPMQEVLDSMNKGS